MYYFILLHHLETTKSLYLKYLCLCLVCKLKCNFCRLWVIWWTSVEGYLYLSSNLRCKTPKCANSQTTKRYFHESVVSLFRTICLLTSNLHTTSTTVFNRISDGYGAKRNPPGSLAKHNPARTLSSVDYKTHERVFLLIIKLHIWRKLFRYKLYITQLTTLYL